MMVIKITMPIVITLKFGWKKNRLLHFICLVFCQEPCVFDCLFVAAQAIDRAFRTARELAPSIVFIDEFQALFACRDVAGTTGYVFRTAKEQSESRPAERNTQQKHREQHNEGL